MRDVDDVEQPEGDGHAEADRRVEAAEEDPGDDGVCEEIEAHHGSAEPARRAYWIFAFEYGRSPITLPVFALT